MLRKIAPSTLALVILLGGQAAFATAADLHAAAAAPAPASDPFWPAGGVFPVPGKTSSWPGFRPKNVERRTLFAAHRAEDQHAIVFFGDSITEGWHTLQHDFAGLGVKVVNRGIGGDTTPNFVYRLQDDVLSLHPLGLVILIGTNDLGEHTSPAQIADNCRVLLQRIRAADPDLPIAWCLVMPRRGDDNYPARIKDLNARLRKLAASDPHITVVDTFTPLAQPDDTSIPADFHPDRLHPDAAGYVVWRKVLYPVLAGWHLGAK